MYQIFMSNILSISIRHNKFTQTNHTHTPTPHWHPAAEGLIYCHHLCLHLHQVVSTEKKKNNQYLQILSAVHMQNYFEVTVLPYCGCPVQKNLCKLERESWGQLRHKKSAEYYLYNKNSWLECHNFPKVHFQISVSIGEQHDYINTVKLSKWIEYKIQLSMRLL